jgi:GT2 family glycosyltransferase
MTEDLPRVTAIVLAYAVEPWLPRCVEALLASDKAAVDVVVVDNGCTNDDVENLRSVHGVTVVDPGSNLGFAAGCNFGAEHATGDFIALVNNDAIVEPATIATLVAEASRPGVGIAGASVRLSEDPSLINSAGNPMHVLGLSWAGRIGQTEHLTAPEEVTIASGACLVTPKAHWLRLGGFDPEYFMYHEDAELSIRTWRQGLRVMYVPDAIAVHRYEFSRNSGKFYLIERNRLMLISTVWGTRSLLVLAPALLGLEAAMVLLAAKQGWLREKVRGWSWLWKHRGHLRRRRRVLKDERAVSDREWMQILTPRVEVGAELAPAALLKPLNIVMSGYWGIARRLI